MSVLEDALAIYEKSGRGASRVIRLLHAEVEVLRVEELRLSALVEEYREAIDTYEGVIEQRDRYREAIDRIADHEPVRSIHRSADELEADAYRQVRAIARAARDDVDRAEHFHDDGTPCEAKVVW